MEARSLNIFYQKCQAIQAMNLIPKDQYTTSYTKEAILKIHQTLSPRLKDPQTKKFKNSQNEKCVPPNQTGT
jgi:hypothetical protein